MGRKDCYSPCFGAVCERGDIFFFFGVIILEPSKKKKKKHAEGTGHSTTLGTALVTPQGTRVPLSPCYLQALGQVLLLPSAMLWVED